MTCFIKKKTFYKRQFTTQKLKIKKLFCNYFFLFIIQKKKIVFECQCFTKNAKLKNFTLKIILEKSEKIYKEEF